jgi:lysozyme
MSWLDMAIDLAKQFEGCSLKAYPDPAYGWKVPSVGYGATGPGICMNTVWTQAQAEADLTYRMKGVGAHIDSVVTVPLTDEQKGALCDLVYNIGAGAFDRSTLLAMLNVGHIQGAADQFKAWNKADGVVLAGLVKRRDAERALFILGSDFSKEDAPGEEQPQPEEAA